MPPPPTDHPPGRPDPDRGHAVPTGVSGASDDSASGRYLLDNQRAEAGERFVAMGELFDATTFHTLEATGVGSGWRCWDVGAGAPGVGIWLADRVGTSGRVLVTDLDTTWLGDGAWPGGRPPSTVTVARHDVIEDPLPEGPFDLIHARLLLVHLPRRAEVAVGLANLLAPGGWLVIEDADPHMQSLACVDEYGPDQVLANRVRDGFRALLARRGADLAFGRTLPRLLRSSGLVDVTATAYFPVTSPTSAALERATVAHTRADLVSEGLVSDEEIDRHLANLASGGLDVSTAPMVSARGRRPSEGSTG